MRAFKVEDMSCGHCVAAITGAVKAVDPAAGVDVDLASRLVRVESARADEAAVAAAIAEAGYTPVAVAEPAAMAAGAAAVGRRGCCCG